MLYSFAITPEVFESWAIKDSNREGVIAVELMRGIADNGLLANLESGRWLTYVRQQQDVDKESPALRDKINSSLTLLHDRNRLIRHPRCSPRPDTDEYRWLHWALERHVADPANPFNGIVATDEYIAFSEVDDKIFMPLLSALDAPCWLGRRKSVPFTKTESALRVHLAPLVRYASKVVLIDPYMTCQKPRFFDTVQHCADLLGRHDGQHHSGQIHIHAGNPENDPEDSHCESWQDRLKRWEMELKPVAQHFGHTFRVTLWKNRSGEKIFHDRYLITDQCGIDARGGLDFLEDKDAARANLSGWTWLEPDEVRAVVHEQFHHSKSPYKYLGSCAVAP